MHSFALYPMRMSATSLHDSHSLFIKFSTMLYLTHMPVNITTPHHTTQSYDRYRQSYLSSAKSLQRPQLHLQERSVTYDERAGTVAQGGTTTGIATLALYPSTTPTTPHSLQRTFMAHNLCHKCVITAYSDR